MSDVAWAVAHAGSSARPHDGDYFARRYLAPRLPLERGSQDWRRSPEVCQRRRNAHVGIGLITIAHDEENLRVLPPPRPVCLRLVLPTAHSPSPCRRGLTMRYLPKLAHTRHGRDHAGRYLACGLPRLCGLADQWRHGFLRCHSDVRARSARISHRHQDHLVASASLLCGGALKPSHGEMMRPSGTPHNDGGLKQLTSAQK